MSDPRLNSLHLDADRREEYRRVRQLALQARGMETIYAEKHPSSAESSPTAIEAPARAGVASSPVADFWVCDQDYLYPLKVGINTMGRSADNDVLVEDLYVSRRHCIIMVHRSGVCEIYDTASKNGTYLNGKKILSPTPIYPGDEIRICNKTYIFQTREQRGGHPGSNEVTMPGQFHDSE
jgi:pSer/pThr/pTyr-binding forkhead associated (FHA) protein